MSGVREEPPSYSAAGFSRLRRHASHERQQHEFTLEASDKRPWAYLRLRSWAPSAKSLPVFMEDQDVSGHVELDIRQPESIKCVEISIKGSVRTRSKESEFLHVSKKLWDMSFVDPMQPGQRSRTRFTDKKLQGSYSWPFSITLPHEILVGPKLAKELKLSPVERLPPSLGGTDWYSAINYRLTLSIKRRGILKSDSSISTLIGYTPTTRPGPPSAARRRAYRDKIPAPGPELDPNGWRISSDVNLSGTLFRQRIVEVTYTLALATPLEHTRGAVIPCYLIVRSIDKQALDLLSNPSASRVTLRRKLTSRTIIAPSERVDFMALRKDDAQPLAKAIWAAWERKEHECNLMGELRVPLSCTPTFSFGELKLEYFVDLHPPETTGFQGTNEGVLISVPVCIVSAYAEDSPRPRAYITPAYDASQRVAQSETSGLHTFDRRNTESDVARPGTAIRPRTSTSSSSIGGNTPPPDFDTSRQLQDLQNVIRSATASSPTGIRRLDRRFSAL